MPDLTPPPTETGIATCMYCNRWVDHHKGGQQIVALRTRHTDGWRYHDIKPTGRLVCWNCIDHLTQGIHPLQKAI